MCIIIFKKIRYIRCYYGKIGKKTLKASNFKCFLKKINGGKKMNFKRKIVSIMLAILMLASAVGCGEEKKTPKKENTSEITQSSNSSDNSSDAEISSEETTVEETLVEEIPSEETFFEDEGTDDDDYDDFSFETELTEMEKPSDKFYSTKLGKYKYVWGDDFKSNTLDKSKWDLVPHGYSDNLEAKRLDFTSPDISKVFFLKDGLAVSRMIRYYDPENSLIQYAYNAGLSTRGNMSYRYGYLEVRARMTFKKDKNSIWLLTGPEVLGGNETDYCGLEIDVFETLASFDSVTPNIHRWYRDGRHTDLNDTLGKTQPYVFADSSNLENEFHLYGFEWTPTEMNLYVDDQKYFTFDTTKSFDNDPDTTCYNLPMDLRFGMGGAFTQGSTWHAYAGDEVEIANLPLEGAIDWVRLYQDPSVKTNLLYTSKK